jgi:DNA-binding beta-propeller fold protein YncE
MHLAADGTILSQTSGFGEPISVSANSADGSCWVADSGTGEVARLAEDGTELWRGSGFTEPWSVSANAADGSCWIADRGTYDFDLHLYFDSAVLHLGADGGELWRGQDFNGPWSVSVSPADGSCWVAERGNGQVVHLAEDGTDLWRGGGFAAPSSVSVNPTTGSCWIADDGSDEVIYLAEDGTPLWAAGGFSSLWSVSVVASDASCWVGYGMRALHLTEDGIELGEADFDTGWLIGAYPVSVSANAGDGSCWVALQGNAFQWSNKVGHLAYDASVIFAGGGSFRSPSSVSVNAADGSCWLSDSGPGSANSKVVHLAVDGTQLWEDARGMSWPGQVSVNPTDGSCWYITSSSYDGDGTVHHVTADGGPLGAWAPPDQSVLSLSVNPTDASCWVTLADPSEVVHLAEDGTELWRARRFQHARSISVNPMDGSLWVADAGRDEVIHMAPDGTTLWWDGGFDNAESVSVNPNDGSCWVAAAGHHDNDMHEYVGSAVVHLGQDGTQLWRGEAFEYPLGVSVNPTDGSCWVADSANDEVVHLADDGTELWRGGAFNRPTSVSVNPSDGSCWVADSYNSQVVRLLPVLGYPRFLDVPFHYWAYQQVEACAEAGIVSGYDDGRYHPDSPVSRAQMAVFISRALAGGDENIPTGPRIPSFLDVARLYWAYDHIEYAKARGVVEAYGDGFFQPDLILNRAQMAVFIARAIADPTGEEGLADYQPPDTATFSDVPPDSWAYTHIEYLADNQVVGGYLDGSYQPVGTVTRDQMAVYIARGFQLPM